MRTARLETLPDFDFETYSEAGYYFDGKRWRSVSGQKGGITAVGAPVYAEHPSTEVLCKAYDLKDGVGPRLWVPGMPPPHDLFAHIAAGGLLEAWNSPFEYYIWLHVCHKRMGWPALPLDQLRDATAKARAWGLPGSLGDTGAALGADVQKDKDGTRLIKLFSIPRSPTKSNPALRTWPQDAPEDGDAMYKYCIRDIEAESAISARAPELSPHELQVWLTDQHINARGVAIDLAGVRACKAIIEQAAAKYTPELSTLTGGAVTQPTQATRLRKWLASRGVHTESVDAEHIDNLLAGAIDDDVRRVLEIRLSLGAASVKKLYALDRRVSADGRLRDMFSYCGAERTGRWAGGGPQPQNLPRSGPDHTRCTMCGRRHAAGTAACHCGGDVERVGWSHAAAEYALAAISTGQLSTIESMFGDAIGAVSGCLRALFCASPGHDLICSDYSAIEAVVLAALSQEQWRLDAFAAREDIYTVSAAKITGRSVDELKQHKIDTGEHHPLRSKLGKVAELASGYQGSVGAWKQFGADAFMTDDEILQAVRAWRAASPNIKNFWYGLQDAAIAAVTRGGSWGYGPIAYQHDPTEDVLYCLLPSGRKLAYHKPRVDWIINRWDNRVQQLTFMGWNSDRTKAAYGWTRLETYGGKLCENVVQAVSRDILAYAMPRLEAAGYPIVLHIHDEIVAEVPKGRGSIEEFESIMGTMPPWASDWPVRAAGGWRGSRYRKD